VDACGLLAEGGGEEKPWSVGEEVREGRGVGQGGWGEGGALGVWEGGRMGRWMCCDQLL